MRAQYERDHIPMEILRSFVTVVDCGSPKEAAKQLDLTQQGVSLHINRLQRVLRCALFINRRLTHRGTLVLDFARNILAINDQLLATAGPKSAPRHLVVGLPRHYSYDRLVDLIRRCSEACATEKVRFCSADAVEHTRDLNAGSMDIAYLVNPPKTAARCVVEWTEPLYWTKSPDLKLDPDERVPLVGSPGTLSQRLASQLLDAANIPYTITFTGQDHTSRKAAAAAGQGLMLLMERAMTPDVEMLQNSFLPKPPMVRTGLFAREGLNLKRVAPLLRTLEDLLKPRPSPEVIELHPRTKAAGRRLGQGHSPRI